MGEKKKIRQLAVPVGEIEMWRVRKDHIIVLVDGAVAGPIFWRGYDREARGVLLTVKGKEGGESFF